MPVLEGMRGLLEKACREAPPGLEPPSSLAGTIFAASAAVATAHTRGAQPATTTLCTSGLRFAVLAEWDETLQRGAGHHPSDMLRFMLTLGWHPYCLALHDPSRRVLARPPLLRAVPPGKMPECGDVLFLRVGDWSL